MSNGTVRIVFFSGSRGEVEKVLRHSTESCSECGAEKPQDLTNEEVEELGREAARVIGVHIDGCWYSGLLDELIRRYPSHIIAEAVKQHPADVQAALRMHNGQSS